MRRRWLRTYNYRSIGTWWLREVRTIREWFRRWIVCTLSRKWLWRRGFWKCKSWSWKEDNSISLRFLQDLTSSLQQPNLYKKGLILENVVSDTRGFVLKRHRVVEGNQINIVKMWNAMRWELSRQNLSKETFRPQIEDRKYRWFALAVAFYNVRNGGWAKVVASRSL